MNNYLIPPKLPLNIWLNVFYTDLPFIKNKSIIYKLNDIEIDIASIDLGLPVLLDDETREIYVQPLHTKRITLHLRDSNYKLYDLITISPMDDLIEDYELNQTLNSWE